MVPFRGLLLPSPYVCMYASWLLLLLLPSYKHTLFLFVFLFKSTLTGAKYYNQTLCTKRCATITLSLFVIIIIIKQALCGVSKQAE